MPADAVNSWAPGSPQGTDYIDASDELIRANNGALEEMVGGAMQNLVIIVPGSTGNNSIDVSYDRLRLDKNSGTPDIPFIDRSASFTIDIDTGAAMNGYETGMSLAAGWKYIWAYRDDTNGASAGLLAASSSLASVTEPDANYRFGRCIGAAYYDGTSAFTGFKQFGNIVHLNSSSQVASGVRSDAYVEDSIATVIPAITHRIMGFANVQNGVPGVGQGSTVLYTKVWLAADGSGNNEELHANFDYATSNDNGQWTFPFTFSQMIADGGQSYFYKTDDEAGSCSLNLWITSYEIKI